MMRLEALSVVSVVIATNGGNNLTFASETDADQYMRRRNWQRNGENVLNGNGENVGTYHSL